MSRIALSLLALTLLISSCSKKVVPILPEPSKDLTIEEIDFEYLHGKARINFKDEKKEREVKANIRVRKDSVIWMDISVVGVSGARALINKDSITIRSNIDKEYFVFEYAEMSKRFNFPITYEMIQSALLGNLIQPRKDTDKISRDGSFNVLEQTEGTILIRNFINEASSKLEKIELKETNTNNMLSIGYSNFQVLGPKFFPYNGVINLVYKTTAGLLSNTIIFEYSKAEVGDRELRFPFNIPKKYVRR